jgi:hypothetical protein
MSECKYKLIGDYGCYPRVAYKSECNYSLVVLEGYKIDLDGARSNELRPLSGKCHKCGRDIVFIEEQPKPADIQRAPQMSDTIQSADDYSEALVNAVEHAIVTGTTASLIKGSIDIATLIKQRDAAIRADEARKQAERYAACIDLAEQVKQWAEAYPTDIFHEPTPKECQTAFEKAGFTMDCFSAMVLRAFTKRWGREATKALADLEAPK